MRVFHRFAQFALYVSGSCFDGSMPASTRTVREHLAAVGAWDGADVARMPAHDALAAFEAGAQALHAVQAVVARFAARIDVICEQSPGSSGYARRRGYASGPALLAARAGMAPSEVTGLAELGRGLLAADAAAELAEREALVAARANAVVSAEDAAPVDVPTPREPELEWDEAPPFTPDPSPAVPRELARREYLARAVDSTVPPRPPPARAGGVAEACP